MRTPKVPASISGPKRPRNHRVAMTKLGPLLLLLLVPAAVARAEPTPQAIAGNCIVCHSPTAPREAIPRLAGRPSAELISLLLAFKAGTRPATIMNRITKGYTDEQLSAVAVLMAQGS